LNIFLNPLVCGWKKKPVCRRLSPNPRHAAGLSAAAAASDIVGEPGDIGYCGGGLSIPAFTGLAVVLSRGQGFSNVAADKPTCDLAAEAVEKNPPQHSRGGLKVSAGQIFDYGRAGAKDCNTFVVADTRPAAKPCQKIMGL
jgi:hypothetical protein